MRKRERHTRKHPAREGAVLIEALIAIGMILTMLACTWFAHAVYAHKLAKIYEARNLAWGATFASCENDGRGDPEPATVTAPPFAFGELTLELGAFTQFECNEAPNDHDDLAAVFEWAFGAGQSIWDEIFELVDQFRE